MRRYYNYEPTPFYFLNDTFSEEEIVKQLNCMKDKGIMSFFLHVRDGRTQEAYGTDLFFENVKFIVEQAALRDIKVWLYDEDSYPSGNMGGKIVMENPQLQARSLIVEKITPGSNGIVRKVLGRVKGLKSYAINRENGEISIYDNCFGPVRRYWNKKEINRSYFVDMKDVNYPHVRADTTYAEMMVEVRVPDNCDVYVAYLKAVETDDRFGTQADCLSRQTTEEFIKGTHEKYKQYVGEYFGDVIPGIFIDEPSAGGRPPYTAEINEYFYKKYGYRAEDNYYKLCSEYLGEKKKFCSDYFSVCIELFYNNFLLPINDWCKKNNLLLTGHFSGEESLAMQYLCSQSVFKDTELIDIPGFDIITNNVGNFKYPSLIIGANTVCSAAAQAGKKRVMAECFALCPYNMGYYGLKKVADWLFACGMNWLVPHAFHYGYSYFQRCDAGKSYFFQDINFEDYCKFSAYAGRVCKILSEYDRNNKVLVVLPNNSLKEELPFPLTHNGLEPTERAQKISDEIVLFAREAIKKHVGWDAVEQEKLIEAKINKRTISIGKCSYSKVYIVGKEDEQIAILNKLKEADIDVELYDNEKQSLTKEIVLSEHDEKILIYKKFNKNGELLFVNSMSNEFLKFKIKTDCNTYIYDAEQDKLLSTLKVEGEIEISLQSYQSVIIIKDRRDLKTDGNYVVDNNSTVIQEFNNPAEWIYRPKGAKRVINTYQVTICKHGEQLIFENQKNCRLRDLVGTQDKIYKDRFAVPYYDGAKRSENIYPIKATYKTEITFDNDEDYILFDKGTFNGEYDVVFNNEKVREFFPNRVYDMSNIAFKPFWKKGSNILEIIFKNADEFDGVSGELYVMNGGSRQGEQL